MRRSTLAFELPAAPEMLPVCRELVTSFAHANGATDEAIADITLAAHEAAANVVGHAYRDRGGTLRVGAISGADELVVIVADEGSWGRPPFVDEAPERGRGLELMTALTTNVSFRRADRGTYVELVFSLPRARAESNGNAGD